MTATNVSGSIPRHPADQGGFETKKLCKSESLTVGRGVRRSVLKHMGLGKKLLTISVRSLEWKNRRQHAPLGLGHETFERPSTLTRPALIGNSRA
jgi:hypothetical protein